MQHSPAGPPGTRRPEPGLDAADPGGMTPFSALVVGVVPSDNQAIASMLTARGFRVTVATTYARARERLGAHPPALLITQIRLAEYNGLQLVLHGKSIRPDMAAIVLSGEADPALQADAEAIGATFVAGPVSEDELAAAVARTLFAQEEHRPVRPPFERRRAEQRATDLRQKFERRRAERRRKLESDSK
jgi:two-component system, response regulator RegA